MITKGAFSFIMGPCLIEDHRHAMEHAHFLRGLADEYHVNIIYKSSYRKDNRTSATAPRGNMGIEHGLGILNDVKTILPTITDVHSTNEIMNIGFYKDGIAISKLAAPSMLQIPAMLSRQTSLLEAAARLGLPVMIKKGQWMDFNEAMQTLQKLGTCPKVICERGSVSGGKYTYVDMELLSELIASSYPVVFDCTHSARSREHSINMAKAAVAMGVDGIFAEVHQKPEHAPSDGTRMLNFDQARKLIEVCLEVRK